MGHGDHWRCVVPDLENGIADALGWVSQGTIVGRREYATLSVPGGDAGADVSVIVWPHVGFHGTFVVVRDHRTMEAYLHTAFPAADSGCNHKVHIDSVHTVCCGLEARISGRLGDAAVTFFDPLYCLNGDRYRVGAELDVDLAGISYSLSIVPRGTKLHSGGSDLLIDKAAVLIPAGTGASETHRSFGDEKAYGLAHIEQQSPVPHPDDYQFCAPVKDVVEAKIGEIPVWKFRATVMRVYDGRQDVDVDIYATRKAMRVTPAAGDEITGTLWLQRDRAMPIKSADGCALCSSDDGYMSDHAERIGIDLTTRSLEVDLLDCIAGFPLFVDELRSKAKGETCTAALIEGLTELFQKADDCGEDLRLLGAFAPDLLYIRISALEVFDEWTRVYTRMVPNLLLDQLRVRGISSFYILDNSIRQDRFDALVKVFADAGFLIVSPNIDGGDQTVVLEHIEYAQALRKHILYVERDATVNYLDAVRSCKKRPWYTVAFRNQAPTVSAVDVLKLSASRKIK